MKILAIIPARGGSKRIPRKNIRLLGGKPLIFWSIEATEGIFEICDTLVSTDDPAIAKVVSSQTSVLVPWLRPAELSTDTASSVDVCLHGLNWYEAENGRIDGLLLLQPTSPFRTQNTVKRGIELFRQHTSCCTKNSTVIGVSPAQSHPMWCFKIEKDTMVPFIEGGGLQLRSQDLPAAYVVNGAFYLISPEALRLQRSFYGDSIIPLVMESPLEGVDIDTKWDWEIAEGLIQDNFSK